MEKQKTKPKKEKIGGGPSNPLGDPFTGKSQAKGNVMVMHGPYAEEIPVEGMTIEAVRKNFSDRFDIAPGSTALIDTFPVDDEKYVLKKGQVLLFVKKAGEKG